MQRAVERIMEAGRRAGMTMMALVSGRDDARAMRDAGTSAFVVSNDQNLLKSAASQALRDYGDPSAW
jgi:2-keto-3-deoxy-L-rhamnonate aldolase RhmA